MSVAGTHKAAVSDVAVGGSRLASCSVDGSLTVWDWPSQTQHYTVPLAHKVRFACVDAALRVERR